jgi:hypothetical protein
MDMQQYSRLCREYIVVHQIGNSVAMMGVSPVAMRRAIKLTFIMHLLHQLESSLATIALASICMRFIDLTLIFQVQDLMLQYFMKFCRGTLFPA